MAGVLGIYGLIIAVIIANAVAGAEGGRPSYGYLCASPAVPIPSPPSYGRVAAWQAGAAVGVSLGASASHAPTRFAHRYLMQQNELLALPAYAQRLHARPAPLSPPSPTPHGAPRLKLRCAPFLAPRSSAMSHFGGGIACGLSGLSAGLAIGIVGESLTIAAAEQTKLFVGMVLILIFAEVRPPLRIGVGEGGAGAAASRACAPRHRSVICRVHVPHLPVARAGVLLRRRLGCMASLSASSSHPRRREFAGPEAFTQAPELALIRSSGAADSGRLLAVRGARESRQAACGGGGRPAQDVWRSGMGSYFSRGACLTAGGGSSLPGAMRHGGSRITAALTDLIGRVWHDGIVRSSVRRARSWSSEPLRVPLVCGVCAKRLVRRGGLVR